MSRVARPADLSEWLTRMEERLAAVERKMNGVQRPAAGTRQNIYGPNILINPRYETGDFTGWVPLTTGGFISGGAALEGQYSFIRRHSVAANQVRQGFTFLAPLTAVRSYTGSGAYIGNDSLLQGQDAVNGNRNSFAWLDNSQWAAGVGTITTDWTQLDVWLSPNAWAQVGGTFVILGTNNVATPPAVGAAKPGSGFTNNLVQAPWDLGGKWYSVVGVAGILDRIRDGTSRGITVGPGPTTGTQYSGSMNGLNPADVQLRGTFSKLVDTSVVGTTSTTQSAGQLQSGQGTIWNASVLIMSSIAGVTAAVGVWYATTVGGAQTQLQVASSALTPGVATILSGDTLSAVPSSAVQMGVYVTATGPSADWSYTVDDWYLRQKVAA
jgi:hypothetical protein